MSDEIDWNSVNEDDVKADLRALAMYFSKMLRVRPAAIWCGRSSRSCAKSRMAYRLASLTRWTMICRAANPADSPTMIPGRPVVRPGFAAVIYRPFGAERMGRQRCLPRGLFAVDQKGLI